ncbi:hypothetical protein K0T92_02740 [Paenibacillus oenotherae]|uniref:Uncharacterized protein n=1 Tax=Paenibacillus oenotherae TaxID=1435645 RepID=A0ABS7D144_9BACL|nr:hypothetical protein [Paenibacillus oenotherae]MBW7473659.1 hypothetical protein [Paenibacillus oenotherae]
MNATADYIIEQLRPFEQLCYQVAHYLLGNDRDAAAASEDALVDLYQSPLFVGGSEEERRALAKQTAIRFALQRAARRPQIH